MAKNTLRIWWLVLLVLLKTKRLYSTQKFTLKAYANMIQSNGRIKGLPAKSISECLQLCLSNCLCSSFDFCGKDPRCVLLRSYQSASASLTQNAHCKHFEIKQEPSNHCTARTPCKSAINCCLRSNPCYNGGVCVPVDDITVRFQCKCPPTYTGRFCKTCESGYTGKNCEIKARSCRQYGNGTRTPGLYHILNQADKPRKVFCDFEKDSNLTWTLVQTYSFKNRGSFFQEPFFKDGSINQWNAVKDWFEHRHKRETMESIQNDSTKWRVTCDFDKNLTALRNDFMQGSKASVNILTFNEEGVCKKVEYVDIRGYSCSNCSVMLYQTDLYPFHMDTRESVESCDLKVEDSKWCQGQGGEDSFGYYHCRHEGHRCSATNTSTTNTWLGG